jgi:glycosyltransferase involved in cell wall biosynthesis
MHMTKKTKVLLSLGRLHPLKGLDLLIAAWAVVNKCANGGMRECDETPRQGEAVPERTPRQGEAVPERTPRQGAAVPERTPRQGAAVPEPWQLIIAGPDEQGTKEKLKAISEKLKMKWCECVDVEARERDAEVVFMGPVQGEAKWALMKSADIFVLPSRSENFGIVVGEALSCGVPVVTTAVGPWGEVGASCGSPVQMEESGLIVVETSVEGIAQGLREMMALNDEERHELGRQGCDWVKQEFSWERVAKQMVEAYGEGARKEETPRQGEAVPKLFC